jgi:hypothetical protein
VSPGPLQKHHEMADSGDFAHQGYDERKRDLAATGTENLAKM